MSVAAVNAQTQRDPTRTKTIRRKYGQNLRGWFGKLNAVIRDSVQSRDVFSINQQDPVPPGVFAFPRDSQKVEAFMEWLREQERNGVLTIIQRNENTYVRTAYGRGIEHADQALRESGVEVPQQTLETILNLPVHREALEFLFTRNFEELEGITSEMNRQISRELADGFARGENPTKIARSITDRVDKIGKTRATVLSRTEVIRAHSEATLNRFERMGVGEVTVKAEWTTAGDLRVCPICQALEGRTFTIQEAREETFTFDNSEHSVRPPAHPQCRCALLPVVSSANTAS